jgi:hypothetical protein
MRSPVLSQQGAGMRPEGSPCRPHSVHYGESLRGSQTTFNSISSKENVLHATFATAASELCAGTLRAVTLALPTVTTFPSKRNHSEPKKAHS